MVEEQLAGIKVFDEPLSAFGGVEFGGVIMEVGVAEMVAAEASLFQKLFEVLVDLG